MARLIRLFIFSCVLFVCLAAGRTSQLSSDPILRLDPGRHTAAIRRIDVDRDGHWLVSASDDKTVRVWEAATGRLARVLRPPIGEGDEGKLYSVAISPDGSMVACGGVTKAADNFVYLFSRATGRLVSRTAALPNAIDGLAFSPDGSMLAATLGGSSGLRLFAVTSRPSLVSGIADVSLSLIAGDPEYGDRSEGVQFSGAGRWLVTSSYDGLIRLYDMAMIDQTAAAPKAIHPTLSKKAPGGNHPFDVKFSPDGSKVAVGFSDSTAVNILSARDLNLLGPPDANVSKGDLEAVTWSRDGRFLFAAGSYHGKHEQGEGWQHSVRRWAINGQSVANDFDVDAANSIVDLAALPGGSLVIGTFDPSLVALGPDGAQKWIVASSNADFRESDFRVSEDGGKVGFAYKESNGIPATFSLSGRSLTLSQDSSLSPPRTSAPGLNIQGWHSTKSTTLNGEPLALKPGEVSRALAIAPDGQSFVIGSEWYLRRFGRDGKVIWSVPAPGPAWRVNIPANGREAVAAFGDGTIRWYRYSDGAELAAFYPHVDQRHWVFWTPGGYYDASPGADDLIGWHINNGPDKQADFFPSSRFRNVKYRPDITGRVLGILDGAEVARQGDVEIGKAPDKAPEKVPEKNVAEILPPVINITTPESGSQFSATSVTVHYTLRTPGGQPVTVVRALIDGRPVATNRNLKPAANEGEDQTLSVPIPGHDCDVSLIAENRFGASVPATVHLTWASAPKAGEFIAKPKLYLLAVGISAYQNADLKLNYAAKDAKDFAAAMQAQKGGLYRDVEVRLLPDATKEDVEDGLDWLQHQVTSLDYGMIFLAGHGVDDANGTYYFLPANADTERLKRTCLVFSDIKTTLTSIAGKAVMFIDTCHSGDVMGKRRGVSDINGLVSDLASAENGVVVFCASTGKQYSLEDPQWQNGAFTKALVEGMNGKASYSHDGKITINMLDLYLSERVKELTKGQQTPATTKPSTVPDFQLAMKPKP